MLNRDAVDVLAFDRYGNYVTQTLLSVYMEVLSGKRGGDLDQFHRVADKLRQVPLLEKPTTTLFCLQHLDRLRELNSGQKIIELLEKMQEEQLLQQAAAATENGVATEHLRDRQEPSV